VLRTLPHHRYVCLRHNYWIGPPDLDRPSFSLDRFTEITRAQRRHTGLISRYGRAAVYDALLTGFLLCGAMWNHPPQAVTDARTTARQS
jgi:hypothetical protein